MSMLVPFRIEIAHIFIQYVRIHREDLTSEERKVILTYAADPFIMKVMGITYFDNWEAGGRRDNLNWFCRRAIKAILETKVTQRSGSQ